MAHANHNTPSGIYCCKCGYDLRAQTAPHRCPECGRAFDPADRRTFLTRPPRGARRWAKRSVMVVLAVGVLLAMCWGWLYWGWKSEQVAVTKMREINDRVEPIGGERLRGYLGSAGWVLDRVTDVDVLVQPATGADLRCLNNLKWLRKVSLYNVTDAQLVHLKGIEWLQELGLRGKVTDAGLIHLKELKRLRSLSLCGTQVTGGGLVHVKELMRLRYVSLSGTQVTDTGLVYLKELKTLQELRLYDTQVTGTGLVHLRELPCLRTLYLTDSTVSDAGLIHLKELKEMDFLDLSRTKVTPEGVKTLQAALPRAQIRGP